MKQDCVDAWRVERNSHLALDLIPKSGFYLVYRPHPTKEHA